jgi:hypothetical protein
MKWQYSKVSFRRVSDHRVVPADTPECGGQQVRPSDLTAILGTPAYS